MSDGLPGSYESMYRSAMEAAYAGQVDKAIEIGRRMVNRLCRLQPETLARKPDLEDTLWRSWYITVQFLRREKRFPEAIDLCNQVADRLGDPDEARQYVGSLMIEQGQTDQGLAYLTEIAKRRQVSGYWVHLALQQMALRQYELAEASCHTALSLAQDNDQAAVANLTLFEFYQHTGQVDQALSAWNTAAVLNTELGDVIYQVTDWLIRRGEIEKARTYSARDRNPLTQLFSQGLIDWHSNRLQSARDKWRRVVQMQTVNTEAEVDVWLEASLRLNEPIRVLDWAQQKELVNDAYSIDQMALVAIAHLMQGSAEQAHEWLGEVTARLQRRWPRQSGLPTRYWALLTSLVTDRQLVESVAHYFDRGDDGS